MVIAQQMQHGMYRQECHFALQRVAVQCCLLLCTLHADDDIAQHLAAVVLIHIVDAVLAQREAEDIRRHGLVAILVVQLRNGGIVNEGHADLSRVIEMFIFQHGVAGTADQNSEARGHLDCFLRICD